ncbi:MAG: hypothetical protein GEV28_35040 [Actinophytocola sp.]|uniref:DUF6881 domain-containing protein n=1 Tax=Actinophytocola sp. TaxID=1872138 RepID=UPI0013222135|nr:hypothetical protein [Actinophytocola sp.]MPZ85325.1 hypothetical protein [Actinophytocola sp.]
MTSYFQRVQWLHDNAEDPVLLWAHVVDGWEVRKVDEFADGRLEWADDEQESGCVRGDRCGSAVRGRGPLRLRARLAATSRWCLRLAGQQRIHLGIGLGGMALRLVQVNFKARDDSALGRF